MRSRAMPAMLRACCLLAPLLFLASPAAAGPLRDRVAAMREENDGLNDDVDSPGAVSLPPNVRLLRDVPYGSDDKQRFDVYLPQGASGAPVIFMVHGGGWYRGDKAMRAVIENKVARWVPRGFIFVSANYRLLPGATLAAQAEDVARALAVAQAKAASWGGDRARFILMGHSAGAHLVALLDAAPSIAAPVGAGPWLGAVSLDSAALDVDEIMQARHARLYDRAFGNSADDWKALSPFHHLSGAGAPFLGVCSLRRADSCPQAERFAAKAASRGMRAQVLARDLSHREINEQLGKDPDYTQAVEAFLRSLDASVAQRLPAVSGGSPRAAAYGR